MRVLDWRFRLSGRHPGRNRTYRPLLAASVVAVALLAGCARSDSTDEAPLPGVVVWNGYVAWDEALTRFDAETAEWVGGFASSVPKSLPERALPQIHFIALNGARPIEAAPILPTKDGEVRAQLVVGNPSARTNRAQQIVCLRNGEQIPCASGVTAWRLAVPGESVAFVPLDLEGVAGSRVDVLLIPSEQAGYPFPEAVSFPLFIEPGTEPRAEVELASIARVWPFDGCGFARVIHDPPPLETVRNPSVTKRDAELILLIEFCDPGETVQLVAVGDRRRVIPIDEPVWREPLRISEQTALIPIDASWFADVEEFQIFVMRNEFGGNRGPAGWFTTAISFGERGATATEMGSDRSVSTAMSGFLQ